MKISDERLRNTRAWAAARIGQMSGAEVIVGAIDELFELRADLQHKDDYYAQFELVPKPSAGEGGQ